QSPRERRELGNRAGFVTDDRAVDLHPGVRFEFGAFLTHPESQLTGQAFSEQPGVKRDRAVQTARPYEVVARGDFEPVSVVCGALELGRHGGMPSRGTR